mgnify:FL=1
MKYYSFYNSPIGQIMMASDGNFLTGLWIENQKYYAAGIAPNAQKLHKLDIFQYAEHWMRDYFNGMAPDAANVPIEPNGTNFQKNVWKILCDIPYGNTATYGEIAKKIGILTGNTTCPRAVGAAIGHNPISIIIPCHRVIGANKKLTGYAGGLEIKSHLLQLEKVLV